jgi:hypothetical protein
LNFDRKYLGKNVGRSTVGKVINTEIETMLNPDRQKRRCVKYPAMEEELYKFVLRHENDAFFSDELVWMKAKEFLKQLDPDAKVSLSWVQRFKERHGIKKRRLHGEAGSINREDLVEQRRMLNELIDKYAPHDVYTILMRQVYFSE